MDHWPALQNPLDQMRADTGAADGTIQTRSRACTQPVPQFGSAAECIGMLADDIAREIKVLWNPVAHHRQVLAEGHRDHVFGIADEDRVVAQRRMAFDMLDHLGVVVGGEERLVIATG